MVIPPSAIYTDCNSQGQLTDTNSQLSAKWQMIESEMLFLSLGYSITSRWKFLYKGKKIYCIDKLQIHLFAYWS